MTPLTERITELEEKRERLRKEYPETTQSSQINYFMRVAPIDKELQVLSTLLSDLKKEWKSLEEEAFDHDRSNCMCSFVDSCNGKISELKSNQSLLQSITGLSREEMLESKDSNLSSQSSEMLKE